MKKFLFLLGLLYLISCATEKLCSDDDEVQPSKSDCLARELTEEEKKLNSACCYVKGKITIEGETQTGAQCMPLAPNQQTKEVVAKTIKDMIKELGIEAKVEILELSCHEEEDTSDDTPSDSPDNNDGSYLKFGFLLITLLLF